MEKTTEIPLETMFPFMKKATPKNIKPKRNIKSFIPGKDKKSKWEEHLQASEIIVLASLLIDAIDNMMDNDIPLKDIPEHPLNQTLEFCEAFGHNIKNIEAVTSSNNLDSLAYKVHTVIRKNCEPLKELKPTYKDYGNNK